MKYYVSLLFFFSLSPFLFADDVQKKLKEMEEKTKEIEIKSKEYQNNIYRNIDLHCTKGSQKACEAKKYLLESKKNPEMKQQMDPQAKKAFEDGMKMAQICKGDPSCLKIKINELFSKDSDEQNKKCETGNKDSCFFRDQSKLNYDWSIYSMEIMEVMNK